MCGLSGFWQGAPGDAGRLLNEVEAMTAPLAHRGPDDHGAWCDERAGLALGHRRLSILDLSSEGHQPMPSADGRYVLVYNGEVYNFLELREELEKRGARFRGHSDTEVLLEALSRWGVEKTLSRLVGMFAFALWDGADGSLVLARDRLGIKPLYYGVFGGVLLFGSELKALRAHPRFAAELDRDALALFFRHNYVPAPFTIYRGVRKLPPGCWARITRPEQIDIHTYWDVREVARRGMADPLALSEAEAEEELLFQLRRAVDARRISDVPLGAFLSGGIDSSLVVALMAEAGADRVRTFTIGFEEDSFDEARYARRVAERLGTNHTEFYVTAEEARSVIPSLAEWWDEPFSDSSQIPTYLVSRLARRDVTVCLSGDGGDELFGGYHRYHRAEHIRRNFRVLTRPGRFVASKILRSVSATLAHTGLRSGRTVRRTRRLAELLSERNETGLYRSLVSHWPDHDGLLVEGTGPDTAAFDPALEAEMPGFLERMMLIDTASYLPDDILCKVDRASMAAGLEARVPMLDHRVVEMAWRLPRQIRVGNAPGKNLLRRGLRRFLPPELFERPKMGFGVPISAWLRGPLREWCEELLSPERLEREGILAVHPIRRRWEEHQRGRQDWGYHLWDVVVFQAWYEHWMG